MGLRRSIQSVGFALLVLVPGASATSASAAGIDWPADRMFPRFASIKSLDIVDISGMSFNKKALFATLQGLVNRTSPRIYLLDAQQSGEGRNFWMDRMSMARASVADPMTLFAKYKSEIGGLCIYDPAVMGTVDVAVTAAGVRGGVVASPALAAILSAAPYGFATLIDLRERKFADDVSAYRWAIGNLWPECNHRLLAGLKPGAHYPLMDYVVANKAMCLWLDPGIPGEKALLDSVFRGMPVNGAYLGWWPGETSGVGYASKFGVVTFASDWFSNASVHGSISFSLSTRPAVAPPPVLRNKCYIAMILSDGDNLQEQEHLFPKLWKDPLRGTFPVSWTQAPAMADFAPALLEYYFATASPMDCFITGPSGVGYSYPGDWKRADFPLFAKLTEDYLVRTGIRTATIWGPSDWAPDIYGEYCPSLLGMAQFGGPLGARYWKGGLPTLDMLPTYASIASQVLEGQDGITGRMAAWDRKKPIFMAPQLNANVAGLGEFKKVYDALKDNPDVEFVRADQLFQLMRQADPAATGLGEYGSRSGSRRDADGPAGTGMGRAEAASGRVGWNGSPLFRPQGFPGAPLSDLIGRTVGGRPGPE